MILQYGRLTASHSRNQRVGRAKIDADSQFALMRKIRLSRLSNLK